MAAVNPSHPTKVEIGVLLFAATLTALSIAAYNEPGQLFLSPAFLLGFLAAGLGSVICAIIAFARRPAGRGTNLFSIIDVLVVILAIPVIAIGLFIVVAAASIL